MGEENVAEFGAALEGEEPLAAFLREQREAMLGAGGAEIAASLGELLSPVDRAVATGDFADYLAALFRTALGADIWGWFDDDVEFVRDWGFALEGIEVPVTVWQGSEDRMVPYAHGEWLATHVAGAEPRLLDGEGHLTIVVAGYARVLDELLASGG